MVTGRASFMPGFPILYFAVYRRLFTLSVFSDFFSIDLNKLRQSTISLLPFTTQWD